jgi:threonine dehydratase
MHLEFPSPDEIRAARTALDPYIVTTPIHVWSGPEIESAVPKARIILKLELFQVTGTFKPRGALTVLLHQERSVIERGVVTVSAGNHAIATAYAARVLGSHARIVMAKSANELRVQRTRALGAEVEFADSIDDAFRRVHEIERDEGRLFLHPFDGPLTALGTATAGLEFAAQAPDIDAMVLPIGGGGLSGGFAAALKALRPGVVIFGVEPVGADVMRRSFAAGEPVSMKPSKTIADSLAPPHTGPYAYALNRKFIDEIVTVTDEEIAAAMRLLFYGMKLAVEPAGGATTAAILGPLSARLAGKTVGLVVCGANISTRQFFDIVGTAPPPGANATASSDSQA